MPWDKQKMGESLLRMVLNGGWPRGEEVKGAEGNRKDLIKGLRAFRSCRRLPTRQLRLAVSYDTRRGVEWEKGTGKEKRE